MTPELPDKKSRPWIPKRKKRLQFVKTSGVSGHAEMSKFYHSKQWKSRTNYKIQLNPICEECERKDL